MLTRKRLAILIVALAVVTGWVVFRSFYPSESFYRSEFELATGFPLPASAARVAGCSEWGATAAVHEVAPGDWRALSETLGVRANRSVAVTSFCPSVVSSFGGERFVLNNPSR